EGRHLEGTVLQRNLVTFSGANLVEVEAPRARFVREGDGWRELPLVERPALRPAAPHRAPLLDAAQQRAVDLPTGGALLLLGAAGRGGRASPPVPAPSASSGTRRSARSSARSRRAPALREPICTSCSATARWWKGW